MNPEERNNQNPMEKAHNSITPQTSNTATSVFDRANKLMDSMLEAKGIKKTDEELNEAILGVKKTESKERKEAILGMKKTDEELKVLDDQIDASHNREQTFAKLGALGAALFIILAILAIIVFPPLLIAPAVLCVTSIGCFKAASDSHDKIINLQNTKCTALAVTICEQACLQH